MSLGASDIAGSQARKTPSNRLFTQPDLDRISSFDRPKLFICMYYYIPNYTLILLLAVYVLIMETVTTAALLVYVASNFPYLSWDWFHCLAEFHCTTVHFYAFYFILSEIKGTQMPTCIDGVSSPQRFPGPELTVYWGRRWCCLA